MVKKIAVALLCVALGSTLYARDDISISNTFVGLEIGYAEVQGNVGTIDGFVLNDIRQNFVGDYDIEFGIRIGAQRDQWRTTFIFDYYDSEDNDQNIEKG